MPMTKHLSFILMGAVVSISACAGVIDPNVPRISYVNFQSLDSQHPLTVSGQLRIPDVNADEKLPAVVVVHGSGGVDSRGRFYVEAFNKAGIATLEIDMWAARGLSGGAGGRPKSVPETLPDAYGALKFLAKDARIDSERIGIIGFSWGGVVAMLTATAPYTSQYTDGAFKFAGHVANYPVCWAYNHVPGYEFSDFTGSSVLIQAGELDTYDKPDSCSNLLESLPASDQAFISLKMYKNATHAWDRLQPAVTVFDPYAYLGKGGEVEMEPNPGKAKQSRDTALDFFQKAFGMDD